MLIIPAIDIQNGCVVRLTQGEFNAKKVYSNDPVKTARHWVKLGAKLIHVVDLDGAKNGLPLNLDIVKTIVKAAGAKIEFGGGIRNLNLIEDLLVLGVWRVVLGTKAAQDRDFLQKAFRQFKDKVIVSIDARDGLVRVKGWLDNQKGLEALEFAVSLKQIGFREVIYTDIKKDGALKGPDAAGIKSLLKLTSLKVIGSGGVSSLADIKKLKLLEKNGLTGIIVGKALYEARFTLPEALKIGG